MLTTSQHGFRPNHSTVTAMLEIANKWFHIIDIGQLNGVVFLDLKKAFDTVDHGILLHKLHFYGIKGIGSDLIYRTESNIAKQTTTFPSPWKWSAAYLRSPYLDHFCF